MTERVGVGEERRLRAGTLPAFPAYPSDIVQEEAAGLGSDCMCGMKEIERPWACMTGQREM